MIYYNNKLKVPLKMNNKIQINNKYSNEQSKTKWTTLKTIFRSC